MKIEDDYFRVIREAGFSTVRVPVKWSAHAAKDAPYTVDPKFFERVDHVLAVAGSNRLNVILNVHHYDEMDKDPTPTCRGSPPSGSRSPGTTRTARRRWCSSCTTSRTTSSSTRSGTTPSRCCSRRSRRATRTGR